MLFFHYCTSGLSSTNISQGASFAAFNLMDQKKKGKGQKSNHTGNENRFQGEAAFGNLATSKNYNWSRQLREVKH